MVTNANPLAPNRIFINSKGFIEIKVVGIQDQQTVAAMGKVIEELIWKVKSDEKPVLILDDITRMDDADSGARHEVVNVAKKLEFRKTAMLGTSGVFRLGANLMFQAVGKGDSLKYFTNREQAVEWLLES